MFSMLCLSALGLGYWIGLPMEASEAPAKEPTLKAKIVGAYERGAKGGNIWRTIFHANGVVDARFKYLHVHAVCSVKWEVIDNEVHMHVFEKGRGSHNEPGKINVWEYIGLPTSRSIVVRIEPNGDCKVVAVIQDDWGRVDLSEDEQEIWNKVAIK